MKKINGAQKTVIYASSSGEGANGLQLSIRYPLLPYNSFMSEHKKASKEVVSLSI